MNSEKQSCNVLVLWVILFLAPILLGQETIYLEQNVQSSGMNMGQPMQSLTKSWISDKKVRIEQPGQIMLLLFDEKKVITQMPKEKQYIEMSFEELDQLLNLSNMVMQATDQKEIVFEKTDKVQKVGEWTAYMIKSETDTRRLQIWLSEDVKIKRDVLIKMYEKMPGMSALVSSMQNSLQFPGFPVLTKVELEIMGMEIKTSIELLRAEKRKFDAELFKIPDGYEQIENPMKMLEE
jgi:uncharacterized protein DUF4412